MKFLHVESWLLDFNLTFRGNPRETMADAAGDVLDGPFRPCASLGALHKVPHVARIVFDFLFVDMAVAQKTGTKMGCPGKWKHGPKPASPLLFNFEPHPHLLVHGLPDSTLRPRSGKGWGPGASGPWRSEASLTLPPGANGS